MRARGLEARRAHLDDLPAILVLLADDVLGKSREKLKKKPHRNYICAFEAINADSNQFLAVFEKDNKIVGCLQLTFIPNLTRFGGLRCQIEGVRVEAELRGQGYGREMMLWAIEKSRIHGCKLVQLTSDKRRSDASDFYKSMGFIASHEGFKLQI